MFAFLVDNLPADAAAAVAGNRRNTLVAPAMNDLAAAATAVWDNTPTWRRPAQCAARPGRACWLNTG
jgi:hypothetical protein